MSRTQLLVGALTDVGLTREHNEDKFGFREPDPRDAAARRKGALFVVCDGMGGHQAGEVASQIAVDTILDLYYADAQTDAAAALSRAVQEANARIFRAAEENPAMRGMGTTCVAEVVYGDKALIAHVGDSRAYLFRDSELTQLTIDHSWVSQQVAAGLMTAEEAANHPMVNVITRALGHQADVEVDITPCLLEEGDIFLLCSDGLCGKVPDAVIADTLRSGGDLDQIARALVDLANDSGGVDNVSVVLIGVVRIEETGVTLPIVANGSNTALRVPVVDAATAEILTPTLESISPPRLDPAPQPPMSTASPRSILRRTGCLVSVGVTAALAVLVAVAALAFVLFSARTREAAPEAAGAVAEPSATARAALVPAPTAAALPSLRDTRVTIPPQTLLYVAPPTSQEQAQRIPAPLQLTGVVVDEAQGNPPAGAGPAPAGRERTWIRVRLDTAVPGGEATYWVWYGSVRPG